MYRDNRISSVYVTDGPCGMVIATVTYRLRDGVRRQVRVVAETASQARHDAIELAYALAERRMRAV